MPRHPRRVTDTNDQPKLLAKDQLVEAAAYVGLGGLVAVPGAFATGFGVVCALIIFVALLALLLTFIVSVNAVRRWRWRRAQTTETQSG